nr:hypothetical protein [Hyphomicrobiales bacterium]
MTDNVVHFPQSVAHTTPLGQFIRLGDDGARALGDLFAAGHFLPNRVVVDASRFHQQRELIRALSEKGVEIVLDPQIAELAALAKFCRRLQQVPWAHFADGAPVGPKHFGREGRTDLIEAIARFAVSNQIDTVLGPAHWLGDPACDDWFERDLYSCAALRKSLDREGGERVAIDHSLLRLIRCC